MDGVSPWPASSGTAVTILRGRRAREAWRLQAVRAGRSPRHPNRARRRMVIASRRTKADATKADQSVMAEGAYTPTT